MKKIGVAFEGVAYPDSKMIAEGALYVINPKVPVCVFDIYRRQLDVIGYADELCREKEFTGATKVSMTIHPEPHNERLFGEMFGEVFTSVYIDPFFMIYNIDTNRDEIVEGEIQAVHLTSRKDRAAGGIFI